MGVLARSDGDAGPGPAPNGPIARNTTTPHAKLPRRHAQGPCPPTAATGSHSECSRSKINAWSLGSEVFFGGALFRPYSVPPYIAPVLQGVVGPADLPELQDVDGQVAAGERADPPPLEPPRQVLVDRGDPDHLARRHRDEQ